jgi:uncharacterized membrane protein
MDDNQLKNELDMRKFLIKKYAIEIIMLTLIFVFLIVARWFNFIDNATFGAIAGLVIGYFASDIRKIHS